MTIVDQEIIGEGNLPINEFTNLPIISFVEKVVQQKIEQHGDAKWLTDFSTGRSMNYSKMLSAVRSVASGLRKRGFQTGDSALVLGRNFIEIPLMSLGIWRAGGILASISVALFDDVIEMRIRECGSKFILTDYDRANRVVEIVKKLDFVREIFVIGDIPVQGCTPFNLLLQDPGDECPENLDVDLDSMAWLTYSSGTTAIAKGVVMTHRVVVRSILRWKEFADVKGIKFFFFNPINNTSGLSLVMGSSLAYVELYCLSNFNETNLMSAIDKIKPDIINIIPANIAWICRQPHLDHYDLSSVGKITVMGSSLNANYEREIFSKFPNMLFLENAYGMAEIGITCRCPTVSPLEWGELDKLKTIKSRVFRSVGKVGSGCKLKVIDVESGEKLGPNQIGEICMQSPYMLKEYFNNPQETEHFIRNGWAHSGDQGYYDEDENIFILGRYKELIKYRGAHIIPTDVERHIMTHPAVEDVAVVSFPDEVDGELPLAFIVLSPDYQNITADELIAYTNERVLEAEKLRGGVRFIGSIPRNGLGKIIRPELVKLLKI